MNAQFSITTTPKYNFPPPKKDLRIPQRFIELSIRSLNRMQSPQTLFTKNTPTQASATKHPRHFFPATSPVKLSPNPTKTTVVAIDVSSIKLGETKTGALLAVRGAIVWRQFERYRYLRVGPFPFHITEKNQNEICSLQPHHQTAHMRECTSPNVPYMQTRLRSLLERWMQTSVSQTTHDSLILWDGSLTAGTPETSIREMEQLLIEARDNQNIILAFSKMTRLLLNGYRVTDLIWKHPTPCLLRLNYPVYTGPTRSLGNIYIAKLTEGSCAFRLDVDKRLSQPQSIEAVQKLLGNDTIQQSYPETLRLAHIFSTFTANEVLGIQRCVTQESNMKIVTRPNVRRILFGRFGKGPEG